MQLDSVLKVMIDHWYDSTLLSKLSWNLFDHHGGNSLVLLSIHKDNFYFVVYWLHILEFTKHFLENHGSPVDMGVLNLVHLHFLISLIILRKLPELSYQLLFVIFIIFKGQIFYGWVNSLVCIQEVSHQQPIIFDSWSFIIEKLRKDLKEAMRNYFLQILHDKFMILLGVLF